MKKFNKDQIQKLSLTGILCAALLYGYFAMLLSPLKARDAANVKAIAETETKIEAARTQIHKGENARKNAEASVVTIASINKMIPNEAPVAWLPPLLSDFFKRQGVGNVSIDPIRKDGTVQEGLADYKNYYWTMAAPKVPFIKMAAALSALENNHPLLAIRSIQLQADTTDPEQQSFTCELKSILK